MLLENINIVSISSPVFETENLTISIFRVLLQRIIVVQNLKIGSINVYNIL